MPKANVKKLKVLTEQSSQYEYYKLIIILRWNHLIGGEIKEWGILLEDDK